MALFNGAASRVDPEYVRLSGEIADDALLVRLSAAYPRAQIEHAYASTAAGVAFAVGDCRAGFPAAGPDRIENLGRIVARANAAPGAATSRHERAGFG